MPPDFLNSREDAILLWAIAVLAFALWKNPRGVGGSLVGVVRALVHPSVLSVFAAALVYSAILVSAAWEGGLWHSTALKATVYWFIGSGLVLIADAVTTGGGRRIVRRVLKRLIAVTVVIEFIVNVYALPFAYEVVAVFLILMFTGMQVVAQHDSSMQPPVRRFIDGVLAVLGSVYLGYFLYRAFADLDSFLTRENAEDFLVGPALTVALVPFLLCAAWLSRWEQERIRARLRSRHGF